MNLETKYWHLHNHQLFNALNSAELKQICLITNFKTAKKGEIIYFSHDEADRVYTIKRGTIKIVEIDDKGNEIVKDILQTGDLFGQFTLVNQTLDEYAVAVSDYVTCCSFKLTDFEDVIERNPVLALRYTKWVGFRLKRMENRYANLVFKDVRARLNSFLKDWAVKEGNSEKNEIVLKNYLTHQDIASLICSTRQTVTQLFNELKEKNILDYSRNEITIKNLSALT
ncbi:Crp/Fnr family transcriptional regulator [Emticicia sp. BO119]|uniref:Crp/Fnr family transcriptional regulator n=1 Tax=Emticicia sp. BO119 TaxID=2757768 RepID=UPI0015F0D4E8|nr:Crp/Fnr family transcriptional regulator [Emticicia sp. BO119]MBA4849264.1 Crp/Fnr family transcriptional regulator [Emticicia sp. BO119]